MNLALVIALAAASPCPPTQPVEVVGRYRSSASADCTVWLATDDRLYRVGPTGTIDATTPLKNARSVQVDAARNRLFATRLVTSYERASVTIEARDAKTTT